MKLNKLVGFVFLLFLLSVSVASAETVEQNESYIIFKDETVKVSEKLSYFVQDYDYEFNHEVESEDSDQVNCYIDGSELIGKSDIDFTGKSKCYLNSTAKDYSFEVYTTITFDVISLEDMTIGEIEEIIENGTPGSCPEPEPEIEYVNCYIEEERQNLTEQLLREDKVIVSKGDTLFEITTDVGTSNFEMFMQPDSVRKRNLYVNNRGLEPITVAVSCSGSFCENIDYGLDELTIQPDERKGIPLTIRSPQTSKTGDEFEFQTVVALAEQTEISGAVRGKIVIDEILGYISYVISYNHLFNQGIEILGIFISNFIISIGIGVLYFIGMSGIISLIKPGGTARFLFEMLRWLGFMLVVLLTILVI